MQQKICHSKLIFYSGIFLKRIEDKEDAVQNAYLLYLRYKDTFKTGTEEQILKWLIRQECFKIIKYNRKWEYKIKHIEDLPFQTSTDHDFVSTEENMHFYTSKCSYNEAPQNIDKQILEKELKGLKTHSDKRTSSRIKYDYINNIHFREQRVFSTQLIKQCGRKEKYYRITTGESKRLSGRD